MDIANSHNIKIDKDRMKFDIDINARLENYNEPYCDGIDCAYCPYSECQRWVHE